jgi:transposase-like protein
VEETAAVSSPTQESIRFDLNELFRGAIRMILELLLDEEVKAMVGARRLERIGSRKDHRNGSYLRRLVTSMGLIDVEMPRTRQSGSPVDVIGRYKRRTEELDGMIAQAYVQGVSTRGMGRVAESLLGNTVSRSTVSRVTKTLEQQIEELRSKPLAEPFPYLYLDATFLDARWARSVENVSALVAYGVDFSGHRRLLGVTIGAEESEESWSDLLSQLCDRGLSGVQLVIADEHRGLRNAVRKMLPEARQQRCTVHLERNVLAKVPRRLRGRVAKQLRHVFAAESVDAVKERVAVLEAGLGAQIPEAIACLKAAVPSATQYLVFPKAHWLRIRSTNGLERLHGEIKRRIRSVGAFPDRTSALRLVTAVAVQTADVWATRRYLDMSLLDQRKEASDRVPA